ncbi:hypothetical protein [Pseudomonas chlororaphis]|uniref:hypothetical protein n=1 Tax=Pseudomonas chlororaphis TaxID=587753 RepID=UPI0015DF16C3|nr:hypothetical protein [Pseudomonas chlororaphis]QLL16233.1 hypothetical protein H0I86_14595 [Pseudomonas chlororaphis subsp. aurantiaca]
MIANQPEVLAMSLEHWSTHPFNRVPEQFAMAPPDADSNERAKGANCPLIRMSEMLKKVLSGCVSEKLNNEFQMYGACPGT